MLDPDEDRLGADALSLTRVELDAALGTSTAPLKARLMDQARIAGVGNLLADEILWRAGLDPARPAGGLSSPSGTGCTPRSGRCWPTWRQKVAATLVTCARPPRSTGCPRDGTPLVRRTVGGRTTVSCPAHQR